MIHTIFRGVGIEYEIQSTLHLAADGYASPPCAYGRLDLEMQICCAAVCGGREGEADIRGRVYVLD